MLVVWRGIDSIRVLLNIKAPLLIALGLALLAWAYQQAGGFGPMLSQPSQFAPGQPKAGQFWAFFFPALTAMVGFWATLSLNIPDFSRYRLLAARSGRRPGAGAAADHGALLVHRRGGHLGDGGHLRRGRSGTRWSS